MSNQPFRIVSPPSVIIWRDVRPVDTGNAVRVEKRDAKREAALLACVVYQLPEPLEKK